MTDSSSPCRVYANENLDGPVAIEAAGATLVVHTSASPEGDGGNEDAAALLFAADAGAVLAVADGVGGHPSGAHAAVLAIDAMHASIRDHAAWPTLRSAVVAGFDRANDAVLALGVGAATTLAVAKIEGDRLRPFHVGDSVVALIGPRGDRKFLSVPHSPVGFAVDAGVIDERDALMHAERHFVTNVVGSDTMHVDVGPSLSIDDGDTILLATDGLLDNLYLHEIFELLREGPLLDVAEALRRECLARMAVTSTGPSKPDDVTFVLYRRNPPAR